MSPLELPRNPQRTIRAAPRRGKFPATPSGRPSTRNTAVNQADDEKSNTSQLRRLERESPTPPPLDSPRGRMPTWAWWVAFTLTVGPISVQGNNCVMQCSNSAPIYASR